MLRPAIMHEFNIILHNDNKDEVIKALHEKGVTEIEFLTDDKISDINEKFKIDLTRGNPSERQLIVSKLLLDVYKVIGILSRFETKKQSFLEEMLGVERIEKEKVKRLNFDEVKIRAENALRIRNEVINNENLIEKKNAELSEIKRNFEEISKLSKFGEIDLGVLGKGRYYTIFICIGDNEAKNNIELMFNNREICYYKTFEIGRRKKIVNYAFLVVVENKNADSVIQKISNYGKILKNPLRGTVSENIKNFEEKINEIEGEIKNAENKLREIFDKYYRELLICKELLEIEKERCEIFVNGVKTKKTVYLKAYVPENSSDEIKKIIEEKSNGVCVIKINKNVENAPTLMENPDVIRKFEFLTSIYGLPKYNHIDPSLFVVPAAAFMIGLMIADAAYGLILLTIALMLRKKYGKYSEDLKNFMSFVAICAVIAIIVGVLNGEYFGNLLHNILLPGEEEKNLPLQFFHPGGHDLKLYLQIAIGFGVIHIWFGTVLGLYDAVRRKQRKEALYKYVSWCLFGLGMIIIFFGPFGKIFGFPFVPFTGEIFTYTSIALIIVGIIIALRHEPVLCPIEAIDYFAFILSYARIMALLVAAGAVAAAFNQLAGMVWSFAFGIFAVLIFAAGQTLHFLLGILSAFVQALRLLYVEHFSRYYEGGGYEFKAFKEERKYTYTED